MKKKRLYVCIILAVFLVALCASANASSLELSVTPQAQQYSNWCWAASSVMSGKYRYNYITGGTSYITQSNVSVYIHGDYSNSTATLAETASAMAYVAYNNSNCQTAYSESTYAYSTIRGFINLHKPVLARVAPNWVNHLWVIIGYSDDTTPTSNDAYVRYIDPDGGTTYNRDWYSFTNLDLWSGIVYWS